MNFPTAKSRARMRALIRQHERHPLSAIAIDLANDLDELHAEIGEDAKRFNANRERAEAAEKRVFELVAAGNALIERWPEGGCVVTPPCGDCTWCRFAAVVKPKPPN